MTDNTALFVLFYVYLAYVILVVMLLCAFAAVDVLNKLELVSELYVRLDVLYLTAMEIMRLLG